MRIFFPLPSSDTDVTSGFADEGLFSHADKLGNQKECPVTPRVAGYAKYDPFFINTETQKTGDDGACGD